jgi:hypothetical protein
MVGWSDAIEAVRARAGAGRAGAAERVHAVLGPDVDAQCLRGVGRLTLNFHPDRVAAGGRTVAAGLVEDGRYRSQWVTWISNGGRSATHGGQRHGWERTLFAGAYDGIDPTAEEYPLYGAFDVLADPHGGSPRFGSAYVVLRPAVLDRVTLCVGDSHAGPVDVGTADELTAILAGLADQAAAGRLLGRPLTVDHLRRLLDGESVIDRPGRELDHYVEAQVHGGVDLATDVDTMVVDPSFRGTDVERDLATAAGRYGFDLRWHAGSELAVADVPADFRGPEMPDLAARVAGGRFDGKRGDRERVVDAAAIGRAFTGDAPAPPRPDGDDPISEAQQLKYLWHTVLAHGTDATDTS